MPTTPNGWPVLLPRSRYLTTWRVPLNSRIDPDFLYIRARQGSVGFNLCHILMRLDNRVEDLDGPVLDEWGHNYRTQRAYAAWSEHAAGAAVDFNALQHPFGRSGTFTTAEKAKINTWLDNRYEGALQWGENWHVKDGMHIQAAPGMARQERVAKRLLNTPNGRLLIKHNPSQRRIIFL